MLFAIVVRAAHPRADVLEEPGNTLKGAMKKVAQSTDKTKGTDGTENTLMRAFAQAKPHQPSAIEEEDDARSEAVSLPPSSRPSSPLSLAELRSEPADEMEEDD